MHPRLRLRPRGPRCARQVRQRLASAPLPRAFANSIAYIVITMIFSVARASLTYDNDVIATTLHISNDFATDVFSTFDSKIIKLTCFPGVVFGRQVLLLSLIPLSAFRLSYATLSNHYDAPVRAARN